MPLKNYEGKAFVAFVDIAGFKKMMAADIYKAGKALDDFFQAGYNLLADYESEECRVQGIFISDCGIIIAECTDTFESQKEALKKLLNVVKQLNIIMLEKEIMLTTSIAYGDFSYKGKFELSTTSKNRFVSSAYLTAYLDSEDKADKLKPGMCRIVCKTDNNSSNEDIKKLIDILEKEFVLKVKRNKAYFYWNLNNKKQVKYFEEKYKDAEEMVYQAEIKALKNFLTME